MLKLPQIVAAAMQVLMAAFTIPAAQGAEISAPGVFAAADAH